MKLYNVAKYIRLSIADGDIRESESVENQRDLLNNYISKDENIINSYEYVDDGYSGGNFDRPGFKKMIEDIENGSIDCVICKDLSRFGRDHIDSGYYLERYFPRKAIRFIAINDGIDTIDNKGMQFLSFKLSFNDYYIQDISKKVKSVKSKKAEAGEYQAGIPVYGYKKDSNLKNHLIIDEDAAKIVKEIFKMFAYDNYSTVKIAEVLNDRNIESPIVHLNLPRINKDKSYYWGRSYIGKMLKNETYLGSVIGNKRKSAGPKSKRIINIDKKDYIIKENMHEAIIDKETWDIVQNKMSCYSNDKKKKYEYIFEDLVWCGKCGGKIKFQYGKIKRENGVVWEGITARCSNHKKYDIKCNNKLLGENALINEVKKVIVAEINNIAYTEQEIRSMYNLLFKNNNFIDNMNVIKKELKKIETQIENLYDMKLEGKITLDDYKNKSQELNEEKSIIEEKYKKYSNVVEQKEDDNEYLKKLGKFKKELKKFLKLEKPTKEILNELIDRIDINDKEITIKFKYKKGAF